MVNALFRTEVLIVDNGRCVATREYVLANFPDFRYEFSETNAYLFSLNRFVAELESEFVFILNDDMKLHSNVLNETLPFFREDPQLFAVGCNIMDWEGECCTTGVSQLRYERGWLRKTWRRESLEHPCYTLYAGAAIFRTAIFNLLEGFDPLFSPAYAEDLDLGHRAWHRGYRIVYNHKAILYHREGGTIKDQYKADLLTQKIYSHLILWMVKNATRRDFLPVFLMMLPYRLLTGWKVGRNSYLALWRSLPRLPHALLARFRSPRPVLTDHQIIDLIGKKYVINQ